MGRSAYNIPPGVLEVRGARFAHLRRRGDTIAIDGTQYEYCGSSAESSVDQPGLGRTLGVLISRVSAPLEMFLSYAAERWLGRGPRALVRRVVEEVFGRVELARAERMELFFESWGIIWSLAAVQGQPKRHPRVGERMRLLSNYIVDRRQRFSTRVLAAYYLTFLLSYWRQHTPTSGDPLYRLVFDAMTAGEALEACRVPAADVDVDVGPEFDVVEVTAQVFALRMWYREGDLYFVQTWHRMPGSRGKWTGRWEARSVFLR